MNWFDVVLLLIIFASFYSGLRTGLARVVLHLMATVVGLIGGFWCYGLVAEEISPYVTSPLAAKIFGFTIIFAGAMLLGSLLGWIAARLFTMIGLGWLDHLLGGCAGLVRGAVIVAAGVAVLLAFNPIPGSSFLAESRVLPYAARVSSVLAQIAPRAIREGLSDQTEKLKQRWLHTPSRNERTA
jgi:membrane protein required for colicin V production